MAKGPKKPKGQLTRVDEDFPVTRFEVKDELRPGLARFAVYGGAAAICVAAGMSFYTGSWAYLSVTAGVTVPLIVLVYNYYFKK